MTKEQMQGTGYHGAFLDCYHFLRRFGEATGGEEFWRTTTAEARTISQKYEGTVAGKLTTALLRACLDEMERKYERT